MVNQNKSAGRSAEDNGRPVEANEKDSLAVPPAVGHNLSREEGVAGEDKATSSAAHMIGGAPVIKEPLTTSSGKEEHHTTSVAVKVKQEVERDIPRTLSRNDHSMDKGKAVIPLVAPSDTTQPKKPLPAVTGPQPKEVASIRKYHGPLFDFPIFTRKHDSLGAPVVSNNNNNLIMAYDVKDLLVKESIGVLNKKRAENLKKIGDLLAVNLQRKRIRPDLVLRLQIEEKKLKLRDLQARLRDNVDQEQQEIMAMTDREYRKFVKICELQRLELSRQVQVSQKAMREKQLKSIFQWDKNLLETHWAICDARTACNRGVAKYHERMLREFSKRKDDGQNRRMEALENNDVERYREMLLDQQTSILGDGAERYAVLSSFLTQTEEYLHKLGGKITAAKNQQYYHLAHAVNESVLRQPSMLRAGTLHDYQLVGLQWMLSLYNNKLNGILADEMGLGKTVRNWGLMALIAYLMEIKGNYGPHLIIVPNAVLVNWKSELHNWLPTVPCIYYVGGKDQHTELFSQEVCTLKFNVLVTKYEFIMYDHSKISKIDWKYIIIDEAQRMKDRESVLARDLDRYQCQRRLLLTGTPLQVQLSLSSISEILFLTTVSSPSNSKPSAFPISQIYLAPKQSCSSSSVNCNLATVFVGGGGLLPLPSASYFLVGALSLFISVLLLSSVDAEDAHPLLALWLEVVVGFACYQLLPVSASFVTSSTLVVELYPFQSFCFITITSSPFWKEGPTHNAEDDWLETEKKVIIIHRLHQILEPFLLRRHVEDVTWKVSIVLRCRMSAFQGAIYDWVKSNGTTRVDPEDEKLRVQRNPLYQAKTILIKLQRTEQRVLVFSTMTKLLDILEEYLQWRRLVYRRIDGTTSLEDRESSIVDSNSPESDSFIYLLSIRATGQGLNLQFADTVIIYDPYPNPKNEEQAVARAQLDWTN
ncbi:hypothetical protein Ancab_036973 [Ancistrocladus abbreviatus]